MARSFLVNDLGEDSALTGLFVVILVSTILAALPVEYNIIRFVRDVLFFVRERQPDRLVVRK